MKGLFMRVKTILVCSECNARNYHLSRNKYSETRLELRKYCPHCKKVTIHKETR
ncbi:50S ribosomal protein L33 [Bacilli bacterium]|nr:50S ribosomal protein L33 [Bacilli bacterium]